MNDQIDTSVAGKDGDSQDFRELSLEEICSIYGGNFTRRMPTQQ